MDISVADKGLLAFGRFRLDPQRRVLLHNEETVKLTPKAFDTLFYLVANAGRVVEKDELLSAVWGARIVEEGNLSQTIFSIRKALQREPDADRWIVTAPGRGYRFTAEVVRANAGAWPPAATMSGSTSISADKPLAPAPRRRRALAVACLALAATGLAAVWLLLRVPTASVTKPAVFAPPPHSVAVLAFANMTGNPGQDYLADGLAEELIDALSRINALHVAARSSSFVFKLHPAPIDEVARALNVSAVLEGSVRGDNGRVRIATRLVDARTGFELWGQEYDRAPGDVLAVETDIGTEVARALRAALLPDDAAQLALGGTSDPAAFDAYLRGVTEAKIGPAHLHAALANFDAAIARDPHYARALAERAIVLARLADDDASTDPAVPAANQRNAVLSAQQAVSLAPTLGVAQAALGRALFECRMDFRGAAAAFARAEELAPGDAEVAYQASYMQADLGHADAAIAAGQRAVALDPLSARPYGVLAMDYVIKGDLTTALAVLQHAEQLVTTPNPQIAELHAQIDFLRGDYVKLRGDAAREGSWHEPFWRAIADHALGDTADATADLRKLQSIAGDSAPIEYADIYAQWGQRADALHWLHEAVRLRDPGLSEIRIDRLLDPVRATQDYKDVEAAIGMPP